MENKTLEKEKLGEFIGYLKGDYEVFGPQRRGEEFVFDYVDDCIDLGYDTTMLPPKKLFFPKREPIYGYEIGEGGVGLRDLSEKWERRCVFFGVHPCDLNGLHILDGVFGGEFRDPLYQYRRKNTAIICLICREPDEYCFCDAMESGPTIGGGWDLLVTDIGDSYHFQPGSDRGLEMLGAPPFEDATDEDERRRVEEIEGVRRKLRGESWIGGLSKKMAAKYNSRIWERWSRKCVLCGACNFTCPTCYCFNVLDEVDLHGKSGKRIRVWDSCQFKNFAMVAGGINFRGKRCLG